MTANNTAYDAIVIGLGKTGLSCVHFLIEQGLNVAVIDDRQQPPALEEVSEMFPDIPVFLGPFDMDLLCNTKQIIISPGVAVNHAAIQSAVESGVELIGDIELFCRNAQAPIIAVTGSNGKSTVTTLIYNMIQKAGLRVAMGGNIGTPALELLKEDVPDYYVLELSSFQLETVNSLNAVAAIILNISADHMDRYSSLDAYINAKIKIHAGSGVIVVNLDDPVTAPLLQREDRKVITYSLDSLSPGSFGLHKTKDDLYLAYGEQDLLQTTELKLSGKHNYSNALAALALGKAIDLPMPAMLEALREFAGLPHRCQWIANIHSVDWFNDSKGTNVGATCAAIEGLAEDNNLVLIAGGESKGADFSPLAETARNKVHTLILIGKDASRIANVMSQEIQILYASNMQGAVTAAAGIAKAGDKVLLSPACASFDMFHDYQHRGDEFIRSVKELNSGGQP